MAGAFWYELVGFAHKSMTEFAATGLLMALLALCVRPDPARAAVVWPAALLAVLAAAVRMQYAPLVLALFGLLLLRVGGTSGPGGAWWRGARTQLVFAAALFTLAVGLFDAVTWDAEPFHSYLANLRFNLAVENVRAASPAWAYLWWSVLATAGLSVLCLALSLRAPPRYGLLLGLVVLALIVHSAGTHKEYRFVFVVVPLWLLIGADVATRLAVRRRTQVLGAAGAVFAAVSAAGLLNALPRQDDVYRLIFAPEETPVRFVRDRDPVFAAYRHLAEAPGVHAVWHIDRHYHALPGYYHLHRGIPLYEQDGRRSPRRHGRADDPGLGQSHPVLRSGPFRSRIRGGADLRRHPRTAPPGERRPRPSLARVHADRDRGGGRPDHAPALPGRPPAAGRFRDPVRRPGMTVRGSP